MIRIISTIIGDFIYGVSLPLRSAGILMRKPSLWLPSLIPILITVGLYYWAFSALQAYVTLLITGFMQSHGWTAGPIISVLISILLFIFSALTFSFAATVISSPFLDWLAEKTEPLTQPPLPPAPARSWFGRARLVWLDGVKSVIFIVCAIIGLVLSWIPGIGFLALGLSFLVMSSQYLSYPQTRRGEGVLEGAKFLFRHFPASIGLGMSLTALFTIPFVSCLVLPLATVSGTLLFGRMHGRFMPVSREN